MSIALSRRTLISMAAAFAAVLSFSAPTLAAERTLDAIKADGTVKIGVEGVFAPFSYRDGGDLIGYDVDLAPIMFKDLGSGPVNLI